MRATPRRRGPRGDVSVDLLLEAADRVLRADGLHGLSLRAVAREAGVTPTVLYTYFADMADLRNQVGDAYLAGADRSLLRQGDPETGLRSFLAHMIELFESSPGHAALLASQRVIGPHALALNEALLDFFIDAVGRSSREASAITMFLTEWLHGRVQLAPSNPMSESFARALARQDLEPYPRTVASPQVPTSDPALDLAVWAFTRPQDGR